jgi:hypothetical protein
MREFSACSFRGVIISNNLACPRTTKQRLQVASSALRKDSMAFSGVAPTPASVLTAPASVSCGATAGHRTPRRPNERRPTRRRFYPRCFTVSRLRGAPERAATEWRPHGSASGDRAVNFKRFLAGPRPHMKAPRSAKGQYNNPRRPRAPPTIRDSGWSVPEMARTSASNEKTNPVPKNKISQD